MERPAPLPIRVEHLVKSYGGFKALDGVSLSIDSGEFLTLLGPSGSGKTTLLMVLAGFIRPTSGHIFVGDDEVTRTPPHKRGLGVVFQNYALFPHMTVGQNIAYPLRMRGWDKARIEEAVREALALVQLDPYADRRPDQLSGGQRQRVALARAVVFEPSVLLMDEPLSALDKKLREQMQIEIRHLHDRLGITTVYVTHDQREALTMSDRIAVIDHGRIKQLDRPTVVYDRPSDLFVADFIGESTILKVSPNGAGFTFGGRPMISSMSSGSQAQGEHHLVLRPEKLEIMDEEDEAGLNIFDGILEEVVFQGESLVAYVRLTSGDLVYLRRTTRREAVMSLPTKGEKVRLALHPDDTIVVPGTLPGGSA